ncbi:pyruvate, water dikinase regulatory protein [Acidomonas methanolica]|uniref:Uncharacterized protein n=3 Tax=Acidomonas methanolica TaxID=437 RepID=A0A023D8E1_ACIMT|nr:pyruvate, water dikinase regulatory protein [Acidomonas methanolica]MBU2652912.1 kinase/pyrophosphorylase [Acidomonas methanolica]TCS31315.1 hypothetical protein EDC31_103158 [Acidomonas methanolica]GAJ30437.1 hypothetical protein Amme_136_015 [Acidomonas methanolica NBRC 104435]GEK98436.1 putative pyruvate, phosphate dikinase regulatory protein [Acidomonas methanolica NBRC 104435]
MPALDIHLVSDATGEMLHATLRAAVAQFAHPHVSWHSWTLVRTRAALLRVVRGLETTGGVVFASIMDATLRRELERQCERLGLRLQQPLDPVIGLLQEALGEKAVCRAGSQYVLDEAYFRRIAAIDFVLSHDDGQAVGGLREADLVLVGLSRCSKTPTAFYLANNRAVKVANVPLIREAPLPPELLTIDRPVVALTIDARRLVDIRRHRLKADSASRTIREIERESPYIDYDQVAAEALWARRLCRAQGWPMIDVTHRSIEETAAEVMARADEWAEKHAAALPVGS